MGETTSVNYRAAGTLAGKGAADHQFDDALRGIAADGGHIYAVGDSEVKIFDSAGKLVHRWQTALPGMCVAVDADGLVWVGEDEHVEVFDAKGKLLETWNDPGRRAGLKGLRPRRTIRCNARSESDR